MDETGSGWSTDLAAFFDSVKDRFPSGLVWEVPEAGDLIDVASGALSGTWSGETYAAIAATGANGYVQGAGCSIEWLTGGLRNGRRVLGRTFLAPLDNGSWGTSGVVGGAALSALQTALGTYMTANPWGMVYSRPTTSNPVGAAHPITSARIPSDVSWLRSRRT